MACPTGGRSDCQWRYYRANQNLTGSATHQTKVAHPLCETLWQQDGSRQESALQGWRGSLRQAWRHLSPSRNREPERQAACYLSGDNHVTFRLTKKSSNKVLTKFHVLDSSDSICGSINVPNDQVSDLLRCWNGPRDCSPQQQQAQQPSAKAFKLPPMSKAAILRGS